MQAQNDSALRSATKGVVQMGQYLQDISFLASLATHPTLGIFRKSCSITIISS
jgi:hypothetical protein